MAIKTGTDSGKRGVKDSQLRDGSEYGGSGAVQQGRACADRSKKVVQVGLNRVVQLQVGQKKVQVQGKKRVGTSGFARWFGLQDEPVQTQDDPVQTQDDPVQTQAHPV
ncbi:hypothetical protein Tco_0884701 [Tanacetum coccineum]